ncbi:MAG: hypothetical protein ABI887_12685 [Burkholderiales bacterium]
MNPTRRMTIAASILALTGCATNQFSQTQTRVEGSSLRNTSVYVYSFLDIRDVEFGPQMLGAFDRQFIKALAGSQVKASVLHFKDSDPGKYYSATNASMQIPVRETIVSNVPNERQAGADYRLVIFPSKMTLSGAWKFYDVRWDLVNVKNGQTVWTTSSQGKHLNAWKNDEDPEARAKTIVDGIVAEMRKSSLL